jgi:hypothetical protein
MTEIIILRNILCTRVRVGGMKAIADNLVMGTSDKVI